MSLPLRPLGDRVLIKADVEDHAPTQTDSGVILATSMASAVTGEDVADSWFVGTIVAVGEGAQAFDVRPYVQRRLREMQDRWQQEPHLHDVAWIEWGLLADELDALPAESVEALHVGDRVTFSWASGQEIAVDGERYLTMRAADVLAVLEDTAA